MHAITLLQDILRQGCPDIHRARLDALLDAARAALNARSHTLSNLARALNSCTAVRHNVRRMDRLLGNDALNLECASVYEAMARYLMRDVGTVLILVDWSDLNADRSAQLIRAAVALEGRSLTLYEEVHSMRAAATPKVHEAFLQRLKALLPAGCQPIIITDAGFRAPWFRAVEALGWHWLGRIRNRTQVREHGEQKSPGKAAAVWRGCKSLYARATPKALDLGMFECVRTCPMVCRLITVKRRPKGRHMKTVNGARTQSSHSKKQAKAQSEPWLLGASTSLAYLGANAVVAIYGQRMQIEQAFRDTKNARFGLGLSESGSRGTARLGILALIASLAEFVVRLMGETAISQHQQYDLQLTNRRSRPEISCIRVGLLLIKNALGQFTAAEFGETLRAWREPHPALRI